MKPNFGFTPTLTTS